MKKSQFFMLITLLLLSYACSIRVSHSHESFTQFLSHRQDEGGATTANIQPAPSPPAESPAASDSTPQTQAPKNLEQAQPNLPEISAQQQIKKSEDQEALPSDTQNNSPSDDFKFYDADGDGFITLEEIKNKVDSLQKDISEEQKNEFEKSFSQLDGNKDSKLSLKEYLGKTKKPKKAKPANDAAPDAVPVPAPDSAPAPTHAMVSAHRRHLQQESFLKSILRKK